MAKVLGIHLLLVFSFTVTICICAHIPTTPSEPHPRPAAPASAIDRAVKVRKRDLQQDEENVDRLVIPMVLSKRSATALGKLMHLLRTSMDQSGGRIGSSSREIKESFPTHSANFESFNLQRRNQKSNYLRCYFNAVSCF